MSFHFEWTAKQADVAALVDKEMAPGCVKDFLKQGAEAFKPDELVRVKAAGHLFNGDYQRSSAELVVELIVVKEVSQ